MHHLLQGKLLMGVAIIGLLAVAGVLAAQRLRTHDQDVTVFSVTPEGKVQVIGLRHRTYLLDFWGEMDMVVFSTTCSTGVLTHSRKEDVYAADPDQNHNEQKQPTTTDGP